MLIAAAVVGLMAWYYFGNRVGVLTAAATLALLVVAFVWPPLAVKMYGFVAVGVVGILLVGPRTQLGKSKEDIVAAGYRASRRLWKLLRGFGR